MNRAPMDISALSTDAPHPTGVINQRGTLLLMQKEKKKSRCKSPRQDSGNVFIHSADEIRPCHNGVVFISFVCNILVSSEGCDWIARREGRTKQYKQGLFWIERLIDLCWQKYPPCPKHLFRFVHISLLVTSGEAIPVEGGRKMERMK